MTTPDHAFNAIPDAPRPAPHPSDTWALVADVVGPRPRAWAPRRLLAPVCALLGHRPPPGVVIIEERRVGWTIYDCARCGRTITREYD